MGSVELAKYIEKNGKDLGKLMDIVQSLIDVIKGLKVQIEKLERSK